MVAPLFRYTAAVNDTVRPTEGPWPPAWWVWVLGQAAVLAAYAARFKISGGYPEPVEATADLGIAVTQLVLASLLGPALLGSLHRLARTLATGMIFTSMASLLAARPVLGTVRLAVVVWLWVMAFSGVKSGYARSTLVLLTIAGPVLWYLSQEYGTRPMAFGDWPTLFVPPLGAIATRLHPDTVSPLVAATFTGLVTCRGRLVRGFS